MFVEIGRDSDRRGETGGEGGGGREGGGERGRRGALFGFVEEDVRLNQGNQPL